MLLQVPGFFLSYFMPCVHRRAIGDACVRFIEMDDLYPEPFIANRDIPELCVL